MKVYTIEICAGAWESSDLVGASANLKEALEIYRKEIRSCYYEGYLVIFSSWENKKRTLINRYYHRQVRSRSDYEPY